MIGISLIIVNAMISFVRIYTYYQTFDSKSCRNESKSAKKNKKAENMHKRIEDTSQQDLGAISSLGDNDEHSSNIFVYKK